MDPVRLGLAIRALRRRRGWTQAELAVRCRLSQPVISRIERGGALHHSLETLDSVVAPLGARLRLTVLANGEDLDRLLDAGHAALVEHVTSLLVSHGWDVAPEVTFSIFGERGSIDVLAYHPASRSLLVIEVKSVIPDVQATLAGVDRKVRLAPKIAAGRGWRVQNVSRWLVVPSDRTTRRRIERHEATFRAAFPMRPAELRRWLAAPLGATAGVLFVSDIPASHPRQRIAARKAPATGR